MTVSGIRDRAAAVLTVGGDEELTPALVARVKAVAEEAEGADSGVVLLLLGTSTGTNTGTAAGTGSGDGPGGRGDGTDSGERAGAPAVAGGSPVGTGIHLVNTWERALRRLETADRPTLALVTGVCTGPALETLLIADHRIADGTVRLRLAGGEDGAWPSTAVHRLAQQIGTARARRLLLRRPWLDAELAAGLDLVDETVTDPQEALERAAVVSEELSAVPGREWSIRRRLLFDATLSYEEALGAHLAACDRSLRRRDPVGTGAR
ncbi:enoyl-CoA-hydratase DpgB [Streptomyces sp. NPDC050804]|uniref:enoyl-CoA-hydratase DpgB n=1 Tax=Streptomyces sp. NPDC050804 TaxID=3154745 RepID=UPI003446E658